MHQCLFSAYPFQIPLIEINIKTNMAVKEYIKKLGCDYVNRHIENIILDVDSTKTQTHGHQEASAYIYHYGVNGYHPMIINEYNTKLLFKFQL